LTSTVPTLRSAWGQREKARKRKEEKNKRGEREKGEGRKDRGEKVRSVEREMEGSENGER
jgi:hypothetical protein